MGEFRRAAGTLLPRTPVVARGYSPAEQLPSKHNRFITHSPAFNGRALGMCPGLSPRYADLFRFSRPLSTTL
ncbi:hypothetical protein PYCCODRAFT_1439291 [Trametes coccinea BRFM310]|uniref:Uncharacterized protein n=1 Tax=Trametes coccinea (strain BRFM310) TaxID=1353009 RepID=A0A1Y2IBC0_TRAC3|nr:hypothetical protein PYCCODRAFT_1439291 [Trametes coccinea BRFM310]